MKILIVEDDADVRRLYALALNQRGFEVKLAANGAEAVDRIEAEQPDLLLLDWLMPLMDGGEVLDKIALLRGGRIVPTIVVSGQTAPLPDQLDSRVGAWLTKPVGIDQLLTAIELLAPAPSPSAEFLPSPEAHPQ